MQRKEDIVVGLDIGTTKICAVVGEVSGSGVNIIGIGTHPSIGLRKGVVVNIEATVESIKKAVEEAELMAGCEISSVYTGIAGGHITGFNSRGIVAIKGPEITPLDVERVIDAARAVAIPMDREVIHVLPQEYIVDDQPGIQNPVGMSGLQAVNDGRLNATVFQDAKGQGGAAVETALKIIKKQPFEKEVFIPFELVTKQNVAQIMERAK